MVRVVGKEGALGAGVGENCSSGMAGSKKITRRYPGRVCPTGLGYPLGGDVVQGSFVCLGQAFFRLFKWCDICQEL